MSRRLISRSAQFRQLEDSPDLQQLVKEGYEVEVLDGSLLVGHIPCRTAEGGVGYGTMTCPLDLAGNVTAQPTRHEMWFMGAVPHDATGAVVANEGAQARADVQCTLSRKPTDDAGNHRNYRDYYEKVTTYISILSTPAWEIDAEAKARTDPVYVDDDADASVFNYIDTASSRAGITEAANKLKSGSVAIVGLGGTGSYILDFLAKTPVEHIHLFDGDRFLQHNASRSPGAPSIDELQEEDLSKVAWFERIYSRMRKNIHAHDCYVTEANVEELQGMDFVFIAADSAKAKRLLVSKLEEWGVPFIDVGMGLSDTDGAIGGQLRTTTSTREFHEHVAANRRISFADSEGAGDDNVYDLNIQIAELNALNAALAVVKWKKLCGFYVDDTFEHHAVYIVDGNAMINEDRREAA